MSAVAGPWVKDPEGETWSRWIVGGHDVAAQIVSLDSYVGSGTSWELGQGWRWDVWPPNGGALATLHSGQVISVEAGKRAADAKLLALGWTLNDIADEHIAGPWTLVRSHEYERWSYGAKPVLVARIIVTNAMNWDWEVWDLYKVRGKERGTSLSVASAQECADTTLARMGWELVDSRAFVRAEEPPAPTLSGDLDGLRARWRKP